MVILTLPAFNSFTEKSIQLPEVLSPTLIIIWVGIISLIGLLSGIYPSIVLSAFKPIKVLKGVYSKSGGMLFRKILVTVQFVVSLLLIVGTLIAIEQLELLQNNDLGFDKEQTIMVPIMRTPIEPHFKTIKDELEKHPDIVSITAVEEIVGSKNQVGMYQFEGMPRLQPFPRLMVRHDFLSTMGIELAAGRDYSITHPTDDSNALVVNESLVASQGWTNEEAVGKKFSVGRVDGVIVGVAKNFNYASKHQPIAPLVMDLRMRPGAFNLFLKYMAVRVTGSKYSRRY